MGAHCRCRVSCQFVFDMPRGPTQITTNKWQLTATSERQRNASSPSPSFVRHAQLPCAGSCLAIEPPCARQSPFDCRFSVFSARSSSLNVRVKTLYLSYLFMFMYFQLPRPLAVSPCTPPSRCAKLGTRPLGIGHRFGAPTHPFATQQQWQQQLCLIYFTGRAPTRTHSHRLVPPRSASYRPLSRCHRPNPQSEIYFILKHIKILQIAWIK